MRIGCPTRGKRSTGMQEKPSDQWANPLCSECHRTGPESQEALGERKFWAQVGIDPFENAERLWAQFCRRAKRTPEQRERVVKRAKRQKQKKKRRPMGDRQREALSRSLRRAWANGRFDSKWPSRALRSRNTLRRNPKEKA